MERTIRVTGRGHVTLKPDTVRLHITIEGQEKNYAAAVERSAEQTEEVKSALTALGFARDEMKTTRFDISRRNDNERDKNGNYHTVFRGYGYVHALKVQFPLDNAFITRVFTALSACKASPDLKPEFTVADPEQARNALLSAAVTDSRAKAGALTASAGVQLGEVQTIDYSWGEMEIYSRLSVDNMKCCVDGMARDMDFTPEDIDLDDTVTVVWSIR